MTPELKKQIRNRTGSDADILLDMVERLETAIAEATQTNALLSAERDKLLAFKSWVHSCLDAHGVPHHPPGPHGAEGCRIGDRMDWLMAERDAAGKQLAALREACAYVLDLERDRERPCGLAIEKLAAALAPDA